MCYEYYLIDDRALNVWCTSITCEIAKPILSGVMRYRDGFQGSQESPNETEFCPRAFGNELIRRKCGVPNDIL
jgi:hypothetical protein